MAKDIVYDGTDCALLSLVQCDGAISKAELGRRVSLSGPAVLDRIKRLEDRGVIVGRYTKLNPNSLGQGLLAFVFVRTDPKVGDAERTGRELGELAGVLEVHHIAGEDCFLVKVRACDTDALGRLLRCHINGIASVTSTRTTIVLETFKESTELPIPEVD